MPVAADVRRLHSSVPQYLANGQNGASSRRLLRKWKWVNPLFFRVSFIFPGTLPIPTVAKAEIHYICHGVSRRRST